MGDGAMWLTVMLLAVVQGIAEFLPVSSSGHLVILGSLLNEQLETGLTDADNMLLNVALHFGTLLSILFVYRKDLTGVVLNPKLCLAIIIATIPAAVLGLAFKHQLEAAFSTPLLVGCCLLVTAAFLAIGQKYGAATRPLGELRLRDALVVGVFQSFALLRGISRSGSTIAGGLLTGLRREDAAAFSFLIAIPVIGGATVLLGKDLWEASQRPAAVRSESPAAESTAAEATGTESTASAGESAFRSGISGRITLPMLAAGVVVSGLVGIAALKSLVKLIVQRRLHWFAWYCLAVGLATIVWQLGFAHRS